MSRGLVCTGECPAALDSLYSQGLSPAKTTFVPGYHGNQRKVPHAPLGTGFKPYGCSWRHVPKMQLALGASVTCKGGTCSALGPAGRLPAQPTAASGLAPAPSARHTISVSGWRVPAGRRHGCACSQKGCGDLLACYRGVRSNLALG